MNCPGCAKPVEAGSAFCRFCGERLEVQIDEEEKALLARTNPKVDAPGVFDACMAYLNRFSDSPSADHVRLTYLSARWPVAAVSIMQGKIEKLDWIDPFSAAQLVKKGVPFVLANGLSTMLRTDNEELKRTLADNIVGSRSVVAKALQLVLDEMNSEAESLMVDGKSRALLEGVTIDDAYREAERYYTAYQHKEYKSALNGFLRLKQLNPSDAYFRNMAGSCYSVLNRHAEALREFLYCLAIDPGHGKAASNLVREMAGFSLFPAIIEVAEHCYSFAEGDDLEALRLYCNLARVCMAIMTGASHDPVSFSADAPDPLSNIAYEERPWLGEPSRTQDYIPEQVMSEARMFISYRRDASADSARRLERKLEVAWPGLEVFRDESDISGSNEWLEIIRNEISQSQAVLVLIHDNWLDERLQQKTDVLRREVAYALQNRDIDAVFPLLLDCAHMPSAKQLPQDLRKLSALNALPLRSDQFEEDFKRLQMDLRRVLKAKAAKKAESDLVLQQLEERAKRGEDIDFEKYADVDEFLDMLTKFISEKSTPGQGFKSIAWDGTWEIKAKTNQGLIELQLDIAHGSPFSGNWSRKSGLLRRRDEHTISGNWHPVLDQEQDLWHGLQLDGLFDSSEPFNLRIPMHRKVGHHLVGVDLQGITWTSENVHPRSGGF